MTAGTAALLRLGRDGAQLHEGAALKVLPALEQALAVYDQAAAGRRIQGSPALNHLLNGASELAGIVESIAGTGFQPVRAVLFDKNPDTNWALGWHQDRTICVSERRDVPGFGPWTVKQSLLHVEPPFELIETMLTIRVHLDAADLDNAPLLIAPGSHRLGRIPIDKIEQTVERCGIRTCLAGRGDVWVYATPIVHASERSRSQHRRRVLQVDYSDQDLPGGLEWCGI